MTHCFLDQIQQAKQIFYINSWDNNSYGAITDFYGECVYRFFEQRRDVYGNCHRVIERVKDNPIVATGIIGYWLHFRDCHDPIASYGSPNKEYPQDIRQQFDEYTKDKLNQFKQIEGKKPYSWRPGIVERIFYTEFIIPNEKRLNKQTAALFNYISKEDQKEAKEIMKEYISYLNEKKKEYEESDEKSTHNKNGDKRDIDTEKLSQNFNTRLNKKYIPRLKKVLEADLSDKQFAGIALLIFNSQYFIKRGHSTFVAWYREFCEIVGSTYHSSYAPSALKETAEKFKQKLNFLQ